MSVGEESLVQPEYENIQVERVPIVQLACAYVHGCVRGS